MLGLEKDSQFKRPNEPIVPSNKGYISAKLIEKQLFQQKKYLIKENEGWLKKHKGEIPLREVYFEKMKNEGSNIIQFSRNCYSPRKIKTYKRSQSHKHYGPLEPINDELTKEYIKSNGITSNVYGYLMACKVKEFYQKKKNLGYSSILPLKNNKYASGLKEKLRMMKFSQDL